MAYPAVTATPQRMRGGTLLGFMIGLILGLSIAVVVAIAIQRGLNVRPSPRAVVIGVRQTLLGLVVVAATATGVLWA